MSKYLQTNQPLNRQMSPVIPSDVLFVSECSYWGKRGFEEVQKVFPSAQPIFWSVGTPRPDLSMWHGDWIISFKSDLILSRTTLESARNGAINFHPCPPKYRGIGGYWWALQNKDSTFGVTCHHMDERIDNGTIIKVHSFPIDAQETEEALRNKAAIHSLILLNEVLATITSGEKLIPCGIAWGSHLYTHKELQAARTKHMANTRITPELSTAINIENIFNSLEHAQNEIVSICNHEQTLVNSGHRVA